MPSVTKRRMLLGIAGFVLLGGGTYVFLNRGLTRLRLSYPPGDVRVIKDIVYVDGSANPKHRLDVYAPADARAGDARPVVHFVHGGYWVEGDKDFHAFVTGLYGSVGQALARRGIVTVVQSYRLSPEARIDGILDDVMAGLRWTETHIAEHGGDPKRVFLMGHSAGGHLAALVGADDALHTSRGMDPRAVRGYVVLSGVWDIAGMRDAHDAAWNAKVTFPVFGASPEGWPARSPLARLHAGMQPYFVVVGEHDYDFMLPQAERARARMTELGAAPRWLVVPGASHAGVVLGFGAKDDAISGAVADFVSAP